MISKILIIGIVVGACARSKPVVVERELKKTNTSSTKTPSDQSLGDQEANATEQGDEQNQNISPDSGVQGLEVDGRVIDWAGDVDGIQQGDQLSALYGF